jgi:hypothetical protein
MSKGRTSFSIINPVISAMKIFTSLRGFYIFLYPVDKVLNTFCKHSTASSRFGFFTCELPKEKFDLLHIKAMIPISVKRSKQGIVISQI